MTFEKAKEIAKEFMTEFNPEHWSGDDNEAPTSANITDTWEYDLDDGYYILINIEENDYKDGWICYIDYYYESNGYMIDGSSVFDFGNVDAIANNIYEMCNNKEKDILKKYK